MQAQTLPAQTARLKQNDLSRLCGKTATILLVCGVLLFLFGIGQAANADATNFATSRREFKVGILILESTGQENPDPYVFHVADVSTDVKPGNWSFVNPLAPGTVTTQIRARWLARDPNRPYQVGEKLRKDMAAYWEVSLRDNTTEDLLQFDLLFIHSHRPVAFTPAERERLRKLVDAGGIVWIEDCGNMTIPADRPFFLEQLQFTNTGGSGTANGPIVNIPTHPILNTPFRLSFEEIGQIGDKNYGNYALASNDATGNVVNLPPNPETLVNIVGNARRGNLPYIAAGNYGSGAVIATAGDSGCDINDYIGGNNVGVGGNSGAFSGTNYKAAHKEDLKFLYNIVSWGSANNTFRRNNRRTAAAFEGVTAPLVPLSSFRNTYTEIARPTDIVNSRSAAIIVRGVMFVSGVVPNPSGGGTVATVRAYDINPFRDADGDGNYDDGLPDVSLGLPYDEIWRWINDGTGPNAQAQWPSVPVFATVLTSAGTYQDRIYFTIPDGRVGVLEAFPRQPNGAYSPLSNQVGTLSPLGSVRTVYPAMPGGVAPAPVVAENKIYTVQFNGLVVCWNAATNTELWRTFTSTPAAQITPVGTPTLGYVRQQTETTFARNSGQTTNDLMLYVPCRVTENGQTFGRIYAYWLGTRNEVLSFKNNRGGNDNNNGILNTRIAGGPGGPQANQYFMASGVGSIVPRARVFAGQTADPNATTPPPITAQQQYEAGNVSPNYTATVNPTTGKVTVQKISGDATVPDPRTGADIIVAVDYDVAYIRGGVAPQNYAANPTGVGARSSQALVIPQWSAGANGVLTANFGLTTPALSTDDLLLFGANQQTEVVTGQPTSVVPSVFAINEQEGPDTSRVRWRFALFNDLAGGNFTVTRQVNDVTIEDNVPLVNLLQFDAGWPSASNAARLAQPEALQSPVLVGSPVTSSNGLTYALARATSPVNGIVTVLMAFRTNPTVVLNIEPFDENAGITLSQADLLSPASRPGQVQLRVGPANPQVTLDGGRGRIVLNNVRTANNGSFSLSQSFVVEYTPRNGGSPVKQTVPPTPRATLLTAGNEQDETGRIVNNNGAFTPLQWYYVLPGDPQSSPTMVGGNLFYTMRLGAGATAASYVVSVNADPTASDGLIRAGYGEPVLNVVTRLDGRDTRTNHVRMVQIVPDRPQTGSVVAQATALFAPPVANEGVLALPSTNGTFTYNEGLTLITDNRRLIEVAADSSVRWLVDSTVTSKVVGGELPVYDPTGNLLNPGAAGREARTQLGFVRPTALRTFGTDYLIADTGNNRVVRMDRSGAVNWSASRFVDPNNLLTAGEPTTLSEPTDVEAYTTYVFNAGGTVAGYEIHYLIADAGNNRIIEVADRYDINGNKVGANDEHTLVWVTRTQSRENKGYRFTGLARYTGVAPVDASSTFAGLRGYPYLTAIVSNSTVGTANNAAAQSAGSSLISLNYNPFDTAFTLYNGRTPVANLKLWEAGTQEPNGNGTVAESINEVVILRGTTPVRKKITAPTFFRQLNVPALAAQRERLLFLICDADGAFVVESVQSNSGSIELVVRWMFTQADYDAINYDSINNLGRLFVTNPATQLTQLPRFRPTSIQLLGSGNYLITNAATGRSVLFENGQFNGEVFEISPNGFSALINTPLTTTVNGGTFAGFSSPQIVRGNNLIPNRQVMGNGENNTGLLEQPQVAIRP